MSVVTRSEVDQAGAISKRPPLGSLPLWIPGREISRSTLIVLLCSIALTTLFLFAGDIQFPGGAEHFVDWANAIAHGTLASLSDTQREVGYPLLVLVSGWPWTQSFLPLLLIQATMAALTPLLILAMLRRASTGFAVIGAAVTMASLMPYNLMKFVHHDQLHIVLLTAAVACAVIFVQSGKDRYLFLATAAAIACTFTRPVSLLVLPIFLIACFMLQWATGQLAGRRWWRVVLVYALPVLMFLGASAINDAHRRAIFGLGDGVEEPSYTGAQLFYSLYVNSADFGIKLSPEIGPNTKFVFDYFRESISPVPEESPMVQALINQRPTATEFIDTQLRGYTVDGFVDHFFAAPNATYFMMLTQRYDKDTAFANALFGSSLEIMQAHPGYVVAYTWRHFMNFLFSPGVGRSMWNTVPGHQQGQYLTFEANDPGNSKGMLPEPARSEASRDMMKLRPDLAGVVDQVADYYRRYYPEIARWSVVLMLIGFAVAVPLGVAMLFPGVRRTVLARFARIAQVLPVLIVPPLVVFYHGLVVSLVAEPLFRYHEMVLMLQITAAVGTLALGWLLSRNLIGWKTSEGTGNEPHAPALSRTMMILPAALVGAGCAIAYTLFYYSLGTS